MPRKNRTLGRDGLEHGTAVGQTSTPDSKPVKRYCDNYLNRKLGRVGKPFGTAVYNRKTGQLINKFDHLESNQLHPPSYKASDLKSKRARALRDALEMLYTGEEDYPETFGSSQGFDFREDVDRSEVGLTCLIYH